LKKNLLWWDDWLVVLAALGNILTVATLWWGTKGCAIGFSIFRCSELTLAAVSVEADGLVYFNVVWPYTPAYIVMWCVPAFPTACGESAISGWQELPSGYPLLGYTLCDIKLVGYR